MKRRHVSWMLLLAGLATQLACSGEAVGPIQPEATEPLALTLRVRKPVFRERLPALAVSGVAGGVRVQVARWDFACTDARAAVDRQPGLLTVVVHVGGNPFALCQSGYVVEYSGVIGGLAPGRYTVRVYEAVGDGTPRRIGSKTVTALPPST
jgi:hypothetical protein